MKTINIKFWWVNFKDGKFEIEGNRGINHSPHKINIELSNNELAYIASEITKELIKRRQKIDDLILGINKETIK